jgi:hypothetical protein
MTDTLERTSLERPRSLSGAIWMGREKRWLN